MSEKSKAMLTNKTLSVKLILASISLLLAMLSSKIEFRLFDLSMGLFWGMDALEMYQPKIETETLDSKISLILVYRLGFNVLKNVLVFAMMWKFFFHPILKTIF